MKARLCNCGSGQWAYGLYDARGIYVQRVCSACEGDVRQRYRPEIFTDSAYDCDEAVEESC